LRIGSRFVLTAGLATLLAAVVLVFIFKLRTRDDEESTAAPSMVGLTIYLIDAGEAEDITDAQLAAMSSWPAPAETVRGVFAVCSPIGAPSWTKGRLLLGVAQYADGTQHRLALSQFGGFFMEEDSGRWYIVDEKAIRPYNNMIHGSAEETPVSTDTAARLEQ